MKIAKRRANIWLDAVVVGAIDKLAKRQGKSRVEWIREVLNKEAREQALALAMHAEWIADHEAHDER